jgi:glutamate-1-semialdehyde 2,1-aminomutase
VFLAEAIAERVPGCERVRFVSSGTEATMSAIRVARGFTGRDRVVKFAGCYHGHADQLLVAGGSGVATLGLPGSAGVPAGAVADTIVAPYNQVPSLDDQVAAVIVEPVAANMGLVAPADGLLAGLRAECDRVGALLIFDEVITGFRLGPGSAQDLVGVQPDLWCFGKVIGGGLPIGAFGGRGDVMDVLAPEGPVYQAGTLSGNPLATAAGLAVLDALPPLVYEVLEQTVTSLHAGLDAALSKAGIGRAHRFGTLIGLTFGLDDPPLDYDAARTTDEDVYARFFHAMLDRGVAMAPGAYEVAFCGLAHTDDVVDEVVSLARDAAAAC